MYYKRKNSLQTDCFDQRLSDIDQRLIKLENVGLAQRVSRHVSVYIVSSVLIATGFQLVLGGNAIRIVAYSGEGIGLLLDAIQFSKWPGISCVVSGIILFIFNMIEGIYKINSWLEDWLKIHNRTILFVFQFPLSFCYGFTAILVGYNLLVIFMTFVDYSSYVDNYLSDEYFP